MFINLQELELHTVRFKVGFPPGEIDYDGKIVQSSVLHSEGTAQLLNHSLGEVRVEGKVDVKVQAICDRCLETASFPIQNNFDLVYMPAEEAAVGGEDEIDQGALEIGYYEGTRLAIKDILREVVLLALPMQLICSEECKGICPICGENRNQRECGCAAETSDDRWNQLEKFRAEIGPRN